MRKGGRHMEEIFKALSEESRLRILALLLTGEMCVCELETCLNMTQSNASRHLTALKKSGILISNKNAQWTYYSINKNFTERHKQLWEYLQSELKNLKMYEQDYIAYEKIKKEDICSHIKKTY
jgi:ArsR family transcriptional regulator